LKLRRSSRAAWAAVGAFGAVTVAPPITIYCTPVRAAFDTQIQAWSIPPKLMTFTIGRNSTGRIKANSISAWRLLDRWLFGIGFRCLFGIGFILVSPLQPVQELPKIATLRGAVKHKFHAKTVGYRTQYSSEYTNVKALDTVVLTGRPILKDNFNDRTRVKSRRRAKVKSRRRANVSSVNADFENRMWAWDTARPVICFQALWLHTRRPPPLGRF
jgi:hypothetical protein